MTTRRKHKLFTADQAKIETIVAAIVAAKNMTLNEVRRILCDTPKERHAAVVCALMGHSHIVSYCFGYLSCERCDAQIGDMLGGAFDGTGSVVVGHNCKLCRKNYAAMGWRDRFMVANPFAKAKRKAGRLHRAR